MDHAVLETSTDRYVILEYLAEGGMGAIYLGRKVGAAGTEKEVVLKQLLPEFTSEPQFIDLFLREARISASLDHENIVHTIDLVAAGNDFFIVMEYVRGADLRTLQRRAKRRGKQLSPQAALFAGHAIADALAYAHAKTKPDGRPLGLIHRDVSPSNILCSDTGQVKLTDFGIAKASTHRSVFYRVKGKVGYMSPEQARGETLDGRSDLYSLAVCIFEALVGERLFVADLLSTPAMIYSQPVPRVSQRRHGLPTELDAVMDKALALKAEDRFQNAGELSEALRRVAFRHGLMYSDEEMGRHLIEVCGADVTSWLRSDAGDERGGGTELYENSEVVSREAISAQEWPGDGSRSGPGLAEGTQLTSILKVPRYAAAVETTPAPAAPSSSASAPRGSWETEETRHYPDGLPPVADEFEPTRIPSGNSGASPALPPIKLTVPGRPAPPEVREAAEATPSGPTRPGDEEDDEEEPTRVADGSERKPPADRSTQAAETRQVALPPAEPTRPLPAPEGAESTRLARDSWLQRWTKTSREIARTGLITRMPSTARGRNILVGAAVLLLLALGIALGVALSDPGGELDHDENEVHAPAAAPAP
jgi:serine/threonine protein kinase